MRILFILTFSAFLVCSCTKKSDIDYPDIYFEDSEIKLSDFKKQNKSLYLKEAESYEDSQERLLYVKASDVNSESEALKIVEKKRNEIQIMFDSLNVPYMGQITKDQKCSSAVEINRPIINNESEISLLLNLKATRRLIYGSCLTEQEVFKSQYLILFCKKPKRLYEIKYFFENTVDYKNRIAFCKH